MYTHTERKTVNGERVEQIMQLTKRQYQVGMVDTLSVSLAAMVLLVSQLQPCIADVSLLLAQSPDLPVDARTKECNDHH